MFLTMAPSCYIAYTLAHKTTFPDPLTSSAGAWVTMASSCCHPNAINLAGSRAMTRARQGVLDRKAAQEISAPAEEGGGGGERRELGIVKGWLGVCA